jgi:hypothetical protein
MVTLRIIAALSVAPLYFLKFPSTSVTEMLLTVQVPENLRNEKKLRNTLR